MIKSRLKILNLYAGIGGNRKLWNDENYEITAVENDVLIADIYKANFPNDQVIIADAHQYLIDHFREYDFIWASPPCPSHSILRRVHKELMYPDMKLYQEIILLQSWYKGLWIIENVKPYYEPLIQANFELHRHLIWCNFSITKASFPKLKTCVINGEREFLEEKFGFDLTKYTGIDKRKALRNCVVPEMGLHILNCALNKTVKKHHKQYTIFDNGKD